MRQDLDATVTGRVVSGVEVRDGARLRRLSPPEVLTRALAGSRVEAVGRRGKFLLITLGSPAGGQSLVVHLGMSGQLRWARSGDARAAHTHVVVRFGRHELRYVDPRTFGCFAVADAPEHAVPALAALGPDALGQLEPGRLQASLRRSRRSLKPLLMDQRFVAGVGNIYGDEILHAAGLRPERPALGLSAHEAERLRSAIREILAAAVAARGSSLADLQYRDLYGRVGGYQHRHAVYARAGMACPRCGARIERLVLAGRSAFACGGCQR